jgi:hypothetical protein
MIHVLERATALSRRQADGYLAVIVDCKGE